MRSALGDYRQLWLAVMVYRHPVAAKRAPYVMALVIAMTTTFVGILSGEWWLGLGYAMRFLLTAPVWVAVFFFLPGAMLLNSPEFARLVPRMRRRLIELTALVWLVGTIVPPFIFAKSAGSIWLTALIVGAWFACLGLAQAGVVLGTLLQVSIIFSVLFHREFPVDPVRIADHPALLLLCTALLAALATWAGRSMFPNGGDRHYVMRGKQVLAVMAMQAQPRPAADPTAVSLFGVYPAILKRDSRSKRCAPERLLLHGLGPGAHWSVLVVPLVAALVAGVVAKVGLSLFAGQATQQAAADLGWLLPATLLLLPVVVVDGLFGRIAATRHEQALLRMAPALAGARGFNRQLARALLRMYLLCWLAFTAVMLLLTVVSGASAHVLSIQAALCALALPLAGALLRDFARDPGRVNLIAAGWMLLWSLVAVAVGLPLGALLQLSPWPLVGVGGTLLAAGFTVVRWRRLMAAPTAFPAGRLA